MLAKKELLLLEALIKSPNQYLSSLVLSEMIGVTDRTTRKYLQNLIEDLEDHGATIISKQGYGYCLKVHDEQVFEEFWLNNVTSKKKLSDISQLEATEDRQRYILNKLLLENRSLDFDELLKELFISKTTLLTDLNRIKSLLRPYGLKLNHHKKRLTITGSEQAIRHFLFDYFMDATLEESILATVSPSFVENIDLSRVLMIVLEECRLANLGLSDYVIHNLVLHIALMVQRIRLGYPLGLFELDHDLQDSIEYQVAERILSRVESITQITFPCEEANYITLHLKVKHSVSLKEDLPKTESGPLLDHLNQVLAQLSQVLQIRFSDDRVLVNGLLAHFSPLLIRLEKHISLSNPLLADVEENYLPYFELIKTHFQQLPELHSYHITDDEWAYIALHVIAAIERYHTSHKKRVLVVCATGYGSAMMLKSRLENELGSHLIISNVVSYYDICEETLKDIDLIISSLNLPKHLFLTPVVNVSVFLTVDDVCNIQNYLVNTGQSQSNGMPLKEPISKDALSLFQPDRFIVVKEHLSKEELLKLMISKLDSSGQEAFLTNFMGQIALRESYSSVVYEDCLAFPHPINPMSYTEQVVVALCLHPIKWSDEHQSVKFVFLLSPSRTRNKALSQLSSCLVDFVADKQLQKELEENPTYHQLVTIFNTLLEK